MIKVNEPLRVFVAMPGSRESIGGQSVPWPEPEAIKQFFYEKIAAKLKRDLKREIILRIEKDKHLSGTIYDSMFAEAWQSEVYIADLTGNNANVYLELGVRWALKDNVTVPVSQNVKDVKFNASYTRVIAYSKEPGLLEQSIDDVVRTIIAGLANKRHVDSPIRAKGDIDAKSKEEIKAYEDTIKRLEDEIKELRSAQGRDLLEAAKSARTPEQRISLYERAIQINPALIEAYLPLAEEQRLQSKFGDALATLERAISLFPDHEEFYRVCGVVYKKMGQLEEAEKSLHEAVRLNDKDGEAWSNLGGLLREKGTKNVPYAWDVLREARDSYQMALAIDKYSAYAQGNVAKLDLLLSKVDPERKSAALNELDSLEALCRLELKRLEKTKTEDYYWRQFDHADSFLLSGKIDEGCRLYSEAIVSIPKEYKTFMLSSAAVPLMQLLATGVLDSPITDAVQKVVEELKLAQA